MKLRADVSPPPEHRYPLRVRITAAASAITLVPRSLIAVPEPPSPPTPVVRTVDEVGLGSNEIDLRASMTSGRETIRVGPGFVTFKLSDYDVVQLPRSERDADDLFRALAAPHAYEDQNWEAIKQILAASGADPALSSRTAVIDQTSVGQVAQYLEQVGLDPIGSIDRPLGIAIANALRGGQVIVDLAPHAGPLEQRIAELLAHLGVQDLHALRTTFNAPIADAQLQKQAHHLNAVVIDQPLVDAFVAAARERGVPVAPDALAGFAAERGLDDAHLAHALLQQVRGIGPRPDSEGARAEWYRAIVESQGFTWRDGPNQMNAIGLRAFALDGGRNQNAFGAWNDTLAFVWKSPDGAWHVHELQATTDPGYQSHPESPDVNGDGRGDVAHLLPGQYPYMMGTHKGVPGAGVPEINVPVARDLDASGDIGSEEERVARERGYVGYGINIHWGPGWDNGDVGPYSLGCQVTVLSNDAFHQEVTPLLAANDGQLLYSLVDMRELA